MTSIPLYLTTVMTLPVSANVYEDDDLDISLFIQYLPYLITSTAACFVIVVNVCVTVHSASVIKGFLARYNGLFLVACTQRLKMFECGVEHYV